MKSFFSPVFVIILFFPAYLFGYLDPGSGSMLFSAIVGIVATLFFVVKSFFFKILDFFSGFTGIKGEKNKKNTAKVVFYSEGPQYWNVFLPVLRELDRRGVKCTYLSSSSKDPGLDCGLENIDSIFIGEGGKAFFFLNTLSADVCVMTTPGLDVLQIKRSRGVKKYVHIPHSTGGGCSGYATYGTDYYDAVLAGGESDVAFIRELEQVRSLPSKDIRIIGCTYMDILREKKDGISVKEKPFRFERTTILISPTWGVHGLLRKHGKKILTYLTGLNAFNIIIRPHPQAWVSDKDIIGDLSARFPDGDALMWDKAPDGLLSMSCADIMISDFSGIIFDFILLFEKPVLAFKGNYDKRGHDSMDIKEDPWVLQAVERMGISIQENDIEALSEMIETKLRNKDVLEQHINYIHESMDKFPGESGGRGADAIMMILQELQKK